MLRIQKLKNIYKKPLENKNIKDVSNFIHFIFDADITKGKYARFLIEAFLNDKFLEEDLIGGLNSTVGQAIHLFHKHKNKLPLEHRSVYAFNQETGEALYQSPGDLWNSVKQYQGELSGKELKREEQDKIYRETEFIYKDEETGFQIVSPLTKESAQWWGKGTRWCTSAEKYNMFWSYAKDSPLFILLMPNGDKLQLWKYNKKIQFMDEADKIVSLKYIEQHWNVLESVYLWLNDLRFIPEKYITKELCEIAINNDGNAVSDVPEKYKTKELYELAVQENGLNLYHVPEEYRTKELCEIAIQNNGNALEYVPQELRTQELCEMAVKQNGWALYYIPEKYKTKEMCEIAIYQNGMALSYVSEAFKTKELCELAVQQNGNAIAKVPHSLRTKELCELAVKNNGYALYYIPEKLKNKELYELAVKKDSLALSYVPNEYKTPELCELAVKQNGLVLQFVPDECKTLELCELAVKQNRRALMDVPYKYRDKLKQYNLDEIIFELPLDKYQKTFQEIKTFFPKKDISLDYHYL